MVTVTKLPTKLPSTMVTVTKLLKFLSSRCDNTKISKLGNHGDCHEILRNPQGIMVTVTKSCHEILEILEGKLAPRPAHLNQTSHPETVRQLVPANHSSAHAVLLSFN